MSLNSQVLEITNFKVDLSLLSELLRSSKSVIITHGGGAHLGFVLDLIKSMSILDQASHPFGIEGVNEVISSLRAGKSIDIENLIQSSLKDLSVCPVCLKSSEHLLSCARCRSTSYCGAVCQRKDWPNHKKKCAPATVQQVPLTSAPQGESATTLGAAATPSTSDHSAHP